MIDKIHHQKVNNTLLSVVRTLMNDDQEKYYFDTPDGANDPGMLSKKEVLMAFAAGVPAQATLEDLSKLYLSDIGKKGKILSTKLLIEWFFRDLMRAQPFMDIFNAIHNGIMVADKDAIVTFINPAYTQLTGVRPKDLIGRKIWDVRPSAKLPEVIFSGKPMYGVHRKVGDVEYVVDMHPIIVNGEVMGGVTIARDITEINHLIDKLRKYQVTVTTLIERVKQQHKARYTFEDIVGQSSSLLSAVLLARKIANSDINVLIVGESGTGKELFAHAIHNASNREQEAFVIINCASIPQSLLESELFGYEAGAFTGASKSGKIGLVEIADHGTLFLDEIGDMNIELQAKILRVLQLGQYQRVGSTENRTIDTRVIAATNRNLEEMVDNGSFRDDLYYRLDVAQIRIPPLKDRVDDIDILANHFLKIITNCSSNVATLSNETRVMLRSYPWPGNIRELENTLKFLVCVSDSSVISANSLPKSFYQRIAQYKNKHIAHEDLLVETVADSEQQSIKHALAYYGKNVAGKKAAAKALGISLATLYNKIKELKIQ